MTPKKKMYLIIKWQLDTLMKRVGITNVELAKKLGKHRTSVSKMRSSDRMPQMDSEALGEVCDALNDIYASRGVPMLITPNDLLDYQWIETPPPSKVQKKAGEFKQSQSHHFQKTQKAKEVDGNLIRVEFSHQTQNQSKSQSTSLQHSRDYTRNHSRSRRKNPKIH